MSINLCSPEAKALVASHLGGQKFDAAGMSVANFIVAQLINDGTFIHNCPDSCGGDRWGE